MRVGPRKLSQACVLIACLICSAVESFAGQDPPRPNILWITAEDHGPHLGCYGDLFAKTPQLDGLARRGMLYRHVWSNAPVCAPARTTILSGMYPTATGSLNMRCSVPPPNGVKMYPQLLREAGYYCTNNSKTDYNFSGLDQIWDESSNQAHWKNRPAGKPFFAIFNLTMTHESQIRKRPHDPIHNPAHVRVPAFHPDTPETRQDWAQYYDQLTKVDRRVGEILAELELAGLAEETIVFYYSDHGAGLPRCKRTPLNSGLRVPLIVHFPEQWRNLAPEDYRASGASDRLLNFVDLAPTVLSLAGIAPPEWMHGKACAGEFKTKGADYLIGFRGRMDERIDCVRSLSDGRYVYARNYLPQLIYGQRVDFMFRTPTTQVWRELFDAGKLPPEQAFFWHEKPTEELYDLETDPDEVKNLAELPEHSERMAKFRHALREHQTAIHDVGLLPEAELHRLRGDASPADWGRDSQQFPIHEVLATAQTASNRCEPLNENWKERLRHPHSAVRYWGVIGLQIRGAEKIREFQSELAEMIEDESPSVRCAAAEGLVTLGELERTQAGIGCWVNLLREHPEDGYLWMEVLNAIDRHASKLIFQPDELLVIETLPSDRSQWDSRGTTHVPDLIGSIKRQLGR